MPADLDRLENLFHLGHDYPLRLTRQGHWECLELIRELRAARLEIATLRAKLANHQNSTFHPDWSMLKEHQDIIRELRAKLALLSGPSPMFRQQVGKPRPSKRVGDMEPPEPIALECLARLQEQQSDCGWNPTDDHEVTLSTISDAVRKARESVSTPQSPVGATSGGAAQSEAVAAMDQPQLTAKDAEIERLKANHAPLLDMTLKLAEAIKVNAALREENERVAAQLQAALAASEPGKDSPE